MNIWKNKESYFLHLDRLHEKGVDFISKGVIGGSQKSPSEEIDLTRNANESFLYTLKEKMSDKLFEHISYFHLKLSIYD